MLGVVDSGVVGTDVEGSDVVDSGVTGTDVEGTDVEGADVVGVDAGADVAGVAVVGAAVDGKLPPAQRSSPFSLIEVKTGSWSPEKLSWNPNSAKSPSFPEKWEGLSREKVCPEPESVPCQKVRESRGKSVVRSRLKLSRSEGSWNLSLPCQWPVQLFRSTIRDSQDPEQ